MHRTPKDFVGRLRIIYKEPNASTIGDLEMILLETYHIFEETYPELNSKDFKEKLLRMRAMQTERRYL